jgi:hypothetical protein
VTLNNVALLHNTSIRMILQAGTPKAHQSVSAHKVHVYDGTKKVPHIVIS